MSGFESWWDRDELDELVVMDSHAAADTSVDERMPNPLGCLGRPQGTGTELSRDSLLKRRCVCLTSQACQSEWVPESPGTVAVLTSGPTEPCR